MKLFWAPHSRSLRVLWLLEEIGASYERVAFDLRAGDHHSPEFHAINPMEKVPALQDGATSVAESGAIFAYLVEKYPETKLAPPLGDPLRGKFWQWLFFASANIEAAMTEKFGQLKLPETSAGWGSAQKVFHVIEEQLLRTPHIVGDSFTAADIMLAANLHFAITAFRMFDRRTVFDAYLENRRARKAFQRAAAIDANAA